MYGKALAVAEFSVEVDGLDAEVKAVEQSEELGEDFENETNGKQYAISYVEFYCECPE